MTYTTGAEVAEALRKAGIMAQAAVGALFKLKENDPLAFERLAHQITTEKLTSEAAIDLVLAEYGRRS